MQALIDFDGWKTWKRSAEDMAAADAAKLAIAKGGKQVSGGRKGKKL